jgi:hypothetical protein
MTVKGSLRDIELTDEPLANGMRVKVMMPGWFYREPEFRAIEREQFLGWIIERQQSIGRLERHSRRIQYVVQLKVIPGFRLELPRNDSASKADIIGHFYLSSLFLSQPSGADSRAVLTRSNNCARSAQKLGWVFHKAMPGNDIE